MRPDFNENDILSQLSIPVIINERGIHAFKKIGMEKVLYEICLLMQGYEINGIFMPNKHGYRYLFFDRLHLLREMQKKLKATPNVKIHFETKLVGIDVKKYLLLL